MPPENELKNGPENDLKNELENDLENEGNRLSDEKNAGENENAFLENDSEMNVENAKKMTVENASEMEGEMEGYFLDPDDFEDELEKSSEDELEEDNLEEEEFDFPEDEEGFKDEEDPLDHAINGEAEDQPVDELLSELTDTLLCIPDSPEHKNVRFLSHWCLFVFAPYVDLV